MKVTFLGTGTSQGVPVIGCDCEVCKSVDFQDKRFRSSIHVEIDGLSLVVDTGPDFRMQMLNNRITRLDAVLFTHAHKDHTAGMDDIRSFNFRQGTDMPVYAEDVVLEQLKREFAYVFAENKYPGVPRVDTIPITTTPFQIKGTTITPIRVMHHRLPVLGFRFGGFTYITDANFIDEDQKELIKGSEVVVLNALQKSPHISHFTFDEAVSLGEELGARKTYLTHISHKLGTHREVKHELPEGVELAYDELTVTLED